MVKLQIDEVDITVRWKHSLPTVVDTTGYEPALTIPGSTICTIFIGDTEAAQGVAKQSIHDQFCRKIGRKLAITRAMKDLNVSKDVKRQIWTNYHKKCSHESEYTKSLIQNG